MIDRKATGLRIRAIRKARKMTIHEFADALGVVYDTVSAWERGLAAPSPRSMEAIEEMTGAGSASVYVFKEGPSGV